MDRVSCVAVATASLVPVSETDASSNIQSGAFTDIDNTIAGADDGALLIGNNNQWTNQSDNTQNGEIIFGLTDAPGDFGTFNSIIFTVRAQVTYFADLDILNIYRKKLSEFDENDAMREGGYTLDEFKELWKELHGDWNPNESVYVIQFKIARQV